MNYTAYIVIESNSNKKILRWFTVKRPKTLNKIKLSKFEMNGTVKEISFHGTHINGSD